MSSHFTLARLTCHIMAFDCGRALAASDDLRRGQSESELAAAAVVWEAQEAVQSDKVVCERGFVNCYLKVPITCLISRREMCRTWLKDETVLL